MPVVFSPGEVEVRPLYPDAIVYTTAQKVAELLGIGPGEAVMASANSTASAVFVTGADYRSHGFSVGDTILIYSDADPLGVTTTISSIANGGASGVQLNIAATLSPITDYETADNTAIQNQAAFTNGKTRGMKRSTVEARIKEIQDRIDNETHNAWRPILVPAEYVNFDTYKPYRRRYYTDYVGTTPLLFRNVQQILRLELWQGDDYREIAAAEARVEIVNHALLSSDKLFLCPGGGGFANLAVGTGTQQWRAEFDEVSTAQALADLVNKDTRTNRGTVTFTTNTDSPSGTTFTLPDASSSTGTTSVHVNNEFIASANADYGNANLKITSMRQTKAGTESTIAVTDSTNIAVTQTNDNTATGTYTAASSDITSVASTAEFAEYGLLTVGATVLGYTAKTSTSFTGVVVLEGTLADGSHTFAQSRFQTDLAQISGDGGDQARLKDWWIDSEMGIIYFNNSYPFFEWNAVKVTYIYGERYVEKAIEEATTKLVACDLLMSDDRSVLIPEGTQNVDLASKIQLWRQEAERILSRYKEVVLFE